MCQVCQGVSRCVKVFRCLGVPVFRVQVRCLGVQDWMKIVWDESVIGRNRLWMKVSLDEPVLG